MFSQMVSFDQNQMSEKEKQQRFKNFIERRDNDVMSSDLSN